MDKKYSVIDQMVNRFLAWKLPADFSPDGGVTFDNSYFGFGGEKLERTPSDNFWPIGTNLLTADQAKEMIKNMISGLEVPETYDTEFEADAYMHGYFDCETMTADDIKALRKEIIDLRQKIKQLSSPQPA